MAKKYFSGFTLIELMIVLSIIAILAALIVVLLVTQISKANDAKRLADINRIEQAVEEYEKDHNCYPPESLLSCDPGTGLQPYLAKIPCDPVTNNSYDYEVPTSNLCPDWYRFVTDINNSPYTMSSSNAPEIVNPSPSPGSQQVAAGGFFGCKSGVCQPVSWDSSRPGPMCDPNYQDSNCYGQCGTPLAPAHECITWH